MTTKCYIGIDPGEKGGICCILLQEKDGTYNRKIITTKMLDESGCVEWLSKIKKFCSEAEAIIEEQQPRPTHWEDKETGKVNSSILRSTCILYGNYRMLCGILCALDIPCTNVLPKEWQYSGYGMKRKKEETTSKWKQRLKSIAHELFPDIKIILDISDSLLLANYLYNMRILE